MLHHLRKHAGRLDHRPFRSQVAKQDGQSARLTIRVVEGADAVRVLSVRTGDVLPQGLPGDGHLIHVQRTRLFAQFPQNGADTTCPVHVFHMVL